MKEDNKTIENDNSAVEIFEENTIITLFDEENKPIEFYEIASIEYNEKFYELLQPVEEVEGIGEDEAVIFEYTIEEGSTDKVFSPIFDEKLLEEVFEVYIRAVTDGEGGGCGGCSGCGGGGCGHDHGHDHTHDCECGEDCDCGKDCDCE